VSQTILRRYISLGLLVTMIIVFSLSSPYFLRTGNIVSILREASFIGIIALGQTFVILTAGIDLSVGSIMALVAMICSLLLRFTGIPVSLIILTCIAVGGLSGLFSGVAIYRLKIPDFIVTLAAMGIYRGITLMISIKDFQFVSNTLIQNETFIVLGGKIGIVYYVTIVFAVLAAAAHVLLNKTRFGTYTYAVGASPQSAELSGIRIGEIKAVVYALSGIMCAVAGIMLTARMMTATPNLGTGIEFDVIAAVVLGGCSLYGGRGDISGTIIGTLFIAFLDNGIYQFHIPSAYQTMIKAFIILIAVISDSLYQKRAHKSAGIFT
jgi:ribose/xylose/arabinose/galactoside ABC-type transport system permease subunit